LLQLPASASQAELLALLARLDGDRDVHGILVQRPLPPQIDPHAVIAAIDPDKDIDGFHPLNIGRIAVGLPALAPRTPQACIPLARSVHASLAGLEALVIGRSTIVGKLLAQLLIAQSATVTVAHSKTRDLDAGSGRGVAARRRAVRRHRPSRIRPRRLAQSGCDRDRCRHQPGDGRRQASHRRRCQGQIGTVYPKRPHPTPPRPPHPSYPNVRCLCR
jgi:hypothetical protein